MLIILHLDGGIDAAANLNLLRLTVNSSDLHRDILLGAKSLIQADDIEQLGSVELQSLGGGAFLELKREHPHPHQIGSVDTLETLG